MDIFMVAAGGALGALGRYWIGLWVQRAPLGFPFATFGINCIGSYFFGLVLAVLMQKTDNHQIQLLRLFLTVGLAGGFTTFSTFSYETCSMIREQHYAQAAVYVSLSVSASVLSCWLGIWCMTKS